MEHWLGLVMGGEPGRAQLSGGPGPQEVWGRQEVPAAQTEVAQCLTGAQSWCGELEGGERMGSIVCRLEGGCGSSLELEGEEQSG